MCLTLYALSLCGVLQNKSLSGGGMEDGVIDLQANVSIIFSTHSKNTYYHRRPAACFGCFCEKKEKKGVAGMQHNISVVFEGVDAVRLYTLSVYCHTLTLLTVFQALHGSGNGNISSPQCKPEMVIGEFKLE